MKKRWLHILLLRRFIVVLLLLLQAYVLIEIVTSRSHASAMANVALTVVSFLAVLHIISAKEKGGFKLAWVSLILLFPVFGGLFYLLFCYQTDFHPCWISETSVYSRSGCRCSPDQLPHAPSFVWTAPFPAWTGLFHPAGLSAPPVCLPRF